MNNGVLILSPLTPPGMVPPKGRNRKVILSECILTLYYLILAYILYIRLNNQITPPPQSHLNSNMTYKAIKRARHPPPFILNFFLHISRIESFLIPIYLCKPILSCRPGIFQTNISVRFRNLSLKFQRFTS